MRDLIWTLILVWFVYRIFTMFRINSPKSAPRQPGRGPQPDSNTHSNSSSSDEAKKRALRKHLNEEGEYVEFEETK